MKLTNAPILNNPIKNWVIPTIKAKVIAKDIYSAVPGWANELNEENITTDAAVVGPETKCQEDPNNAAIIAGTMLA